MEMDINLKELDITNGRGTGEINLFGVTMFRYIGILLPIFCHIWDEKYRSLYGGGLHYIEVL